MELYKKIIYGIFIVNGVIIVDSLLPPIERNEVYNMRSDVVTHPNGGFHYSSRWYTTDYLVTTNGHHYELPNNTYMLRTEGDSVTVGITRLFRQPMRVRWNDKGQQQEVDIRTYTHRYFYPVLLWLTTIFSLFLLGFPSVLSKDRKVQLLAACAFIAAMIFQSYFL